MSTETYIVNATTRGLAKYQDNDWDSLIGASEQKGYFIALGSTGLFTNSGSSDNSTMIRGVIKTGKLLLAGHRRFNIPKVIIVGAGSGVVRVGYSVDIDGTDVKAVTRSAALTPGVQEHEVILETKYEASSYQFTLTMTRSGDELFDFLVYVNPVRNRRG